MINPCMDHLPRRMRKQLVELERQRRKSGEWGEWERLSFPPGTVGRRGWPAEISIAYRNKVFSVLWRVLDRGVVHLAVSSLSGDRPAWKEMQRIKNDLVGCPWTAVEVYPPQHEVVDGADMFHIWVLPTGLPFSLYDRERAAEALADDIGCRPVMAEAKTELDLLRQIAKYAQRFCEALQEDAEGVPQAELGCLHNALDAWEREFAQ